MANNLTVTIGADTQGFEANIAQAPKTLNKYKNEAHSTSKEIQNNVGVTKQQIASYERVINQLTKVSEGTLTVKQESKKLTDQINELKVQWSRLTDEQKRSDFGQSISSSMQTAQNRLKDIKSQIGDTSRKASSDFQLLKSSALQVTAAIGAMKVAVDLFKEAIEKNETAIDAWGRLGEQTTRMWDSALTALSNHDFSNLFANFKNAYEYGEKLYNLWDDVGSFDNGNKTKIASLNEDIAKLKRELRKATTEEAKKNIQKQIESKTKQKEEVEKTSISKTKNAAREEIKAIIVEALEGTNVKESSIDKYVNSILKMGSYDFKKFLEDYKRGLTFEGRGVGDREFDAIQRIIDKETAIQKAEEKYANAIQRNADLINQDNRNIAKVTPTPTVTPTTAPNAKQTEITTPINYDVANDQYYDIYANINFKSIKSITDNIAFLKKYIEDININADWFDVKNKKVVSAYNVIKDVNNQIKELEKELFNIKNLSNNNEGVIIGKDEELKGVKEYINSTKGILDNTKQLKATYEDIASVVGNIGYAFSSWNDEGLDTAGIIANAIATMIAGYAQASKMAAEIGGPWGWLSFGALGLAELGQSINQIKALSKYADGGIIGGKTTIGDFNLARVNKGEMILNGRQQGNLFNILDNGINSNYNSMPSNVRFRIEGKDLVGILSNYNNRLNRIR